MAGGTLGFGRAFAVAVLISVVASLCYVATWELIYWKLTPDFGAKYQAHLLDKARKNGESEEAIVRKKAELDGFLKLYQNPAINVAITFLEPLPVALVVSLVSAGVLSRRKNANAGQPTRYARTGTDGNE